MRGRTSERTYTLALSQRGRGQEGRLPTKFNPLTKERKRKMSEKFPKNPKNTLQSSWGGENPSSCSCVDTVLGTSPIKYELKEIKPIEDDKCCYDVEVVWTFTDEVDWRPYGKLDTPNWEDKNSVRHYFLSRIGKYSEGTLDLVFDQVIGANFKVSGQKTEHRKICCSK